MCDTDKTYCVAVFGLVEDPSRPVEEHCDFDMFRLTEDSLAEVGRPLRCKRTARQHDANASTVFASQPPEPPAKRLVEIGISRSHPREGSPNQCLAHPLRLGHLALIERNQVRPLLLPLGLLRLLLSLGKSPQARKVTRPKGMFPLWSLPAMADCR